MPTYDYQCVKCGYKIEIVESIRSPGLDRMCPNCMKPSGLRRLIGRGGGIIFKGSGFYCTDYREGKKDEEPKESTST